MVGEIFTSWMRWEIWDKNSVIVQDLEIQKRWK